MKRSDWAFLRTVSGSVAGPAAKLKTRSGFEEQVMERELLGLVGWAEMRWVVKRDLWGLGKRGVGVVDPVMDMIFAAMVLGVCFGIAGVCVLYVYVYVL